MQLSASKQKRPPAIALTLRVQVALTDARIIRFWPMCLHKDMSRFAAERLQSGGVAPPLVLCEFRNHISVRVIPLHALKKRPNTPECSGLCALLSQTLTRSKRSVTSLEFPFNHTAQLVQNPRTTRISLLCHVFSWHPGTMSSNHHFRLCAGLYAATDSVR